MRPSLESAPTLAGRPKPGSYGRPIAVLDQAGRLTTQHGIRQISRKKAQKAKTKLKLKLKVAEASRLCNRAGTALPHCPTTDVASLAKNGSVSQLYSPRQAG
jgi:hypothetical protein